MNWREENQFYLNNKGVIAFNGKCYMCSKPCKQSCNVLGMRCRHYEKAVDRLPREQQVIMFWKEDNPKGSKKKCIEDIGLTKTTVYKYWELQQRNAPDVPTPDSKNVAGETE